MQLFKILAASALAIALSVSAAEAYPRNPPGPRGGPGTNWHNPPGPRGGPGASPYRHGRWRYHHPNYRAWRRAYWGRRAYYWWPERRCWYDPFFNPPGPVGGPGAGPVVCRW